MNIETFARQSHHVCTVTCLMNLEYLLAYSYDCGIVLVVHHGVSVCAKSPIILRENDNLRTRINR